MSDETVNEQLDGAESGRNGPLAGQRLAQLRREQNISVHEIAKELHLDEPKVRALENNDFEMLGAPVFAKGHLKKYAQLVGADADELLADYYALRGSTGMPPVVGRVRRPERSLSPMPVVAVIVVLLAAAAAYWYFVVRPAVPAAAVPATREPAPAVSVEAADSNDFVDEIGDEPTEAVDEPATAILLDAEPETSVALPAEPPPADGVVRLTIAFSGDCWTEISDADGRRLFFDLGRAGRSVTVSGRGPLSALFGSADNVQLTVNGSALPITAADRRGNTARMTISAPQ